jgi:hypothetical protein
MIACPDLPAAYAAWHRPAGGSQFDDRRFSRRTDFEGVGELALFHGQAGL